MKARVLVLTILIAIFGAGASWAWGPEAKTVKPDAAKLKLTAYSVTLKLVLNDVVDGTPCSNDYAICASGDCNCFEFSGTATGTAGSGAAEFSFTYDFGDIVPTYNDNGDCAPVAGEIDISGSKDDEVLLISGSACDTLNGGSPLIGGFSLVDTNIFIEGAAGTYLGSFTGSSTFKLVLTGQASK